MSDRSAGSLIYRLLVNDRYAELRGKGLAHWVRIIMEHPGFVNGVKDAFENWGGPINEVGCWWPDGIKHSNEDEAPPEHDVVYQVCDVEGCSYVADYVQSLS